MRQMKKKIIIAILITLLLTAGIAFLISNNVIKGKDEEIAQLKEQVADTKCLAFAKDLTADSIITQDDITQVSVKTTSLSSGCYEYSNNTTAKHYLVIENDDGTKETSRTEMLIENLVGRVVKANVSANTLIIDSLLYPEGAEPTKDERIQEFNFLKLPSDLVTNDYVDIRIRFPHGEDYGVLIGKKVEKIAGENTIFIKLNEEEIMTMGSAIIEAYMQTGVSLYANKYTDPATQLFNEEIVDYVAKYDYAVERLIKEKTELELRREIADLIMWDTDGNSLIDADGNIPYRIPAGSVMDLEGTIASESTVVLIPTTSAILEVENEEGEKEEVEAFYIAAEMLPIILEEHRTQAEANIPAFTVEDFENIDIAAYAGIEEEYVEEIRLAQLENDTGVLNYYKVKRVLTRDAIIRTYPVRREVLAVIKNNPNLLDTIIAEFDANILLNTRVDEYYELVDERDALLAEYNATMDPYAKQEMEFKLEELENEIKSIDSGRVGSIEGKLSKEINDQRAERVSYLEALIEG